MSPERFVISLVDDGLVAAIIFEWSILKVLLSGLFSFSVDCSMIVRSYPESIEQSEQSCDDE